VVKDSTFQKILQVSGLVWTRLRLSSQTSGWVQLPPVTSWARSDTSLMSRRVKDSTFKKFLQVSETWPRMWLVVA